MTRGSLVVCVVLLLKGSSFCFLTLPSPSIFSLLLLLNFSLPKGQSIDRSHQSFNQDDSHRSDPFDSDLDALSISLRGSRCGHGAKGLEDQVLISCYSLGNGFES